MHHVFWKVYWLFHINSKLTKLLFLFSQNQIELVKSNGPYYMGKIFMSHMHNQSFDCDTVYKAWSSKMLGRH